MMDESEKLKRVTAFVNYSCSLSFSTELEGGEFNVNASRKINGIVHQCKIHGKLEGNRVNFKMQFNDKNPVLIQAMINYIEDVVPGYKVLIVPEENKQ
jgi:predicted nucleotidyltransferase component of viral defense system